MDAEVARRRVSTIAGHFVTGDDLPATHQHILPVNCSGIVNSVTRRCDNKLLFARQASHARGSFMQEASATDQAIGSDQPACNEYGTPIFSRPSRMDPNLPRMAIFQPLAQGCSLSSTEPPPQFARPNQSIIGNSINKGYNWSPRMDVMESPCGYVLKVEIPRVAANDIRVEINDRNDGFLQVIVPKN